MVPSMQLPSTQAYPKRKSQCKQRRGLLKFDLSRVEFHARNRRSNGDPILDATFLP